MRPSNLALQDSASEQNSKKSISQVASFNVPLTSLPCKVVNCKKKLYFAYWFDAHKEKIKKLKLKHFKAVLSVYLRSESKKIYNMSQLGTI